MQFSSKLLAGITTIALLLPVASAQPTNFPDVPSGEWFHEHVQSLAGQGIVSGYIDGYFRPGNNITRAEFAKMAVLTLETKDPGSLVEGAAGTFNDVTPGAWYYDVVNQAAANGIVNGDEGKGTFRPNDPISRSEAVQVLYNASPALKEATDFASSYTEETNPENFHDVDPTDWFYNAVVGAFVSDLVQGTSGITFEPDRPITRAESAKVINIFLEME